MRCAPQRGKVQLPPLVSNHVNRRLTQDQPGDANLLPEQGKKLHIDLEISRAKGVLLRKRCVISESKVFQAYPDAPPQGDADVVYRDLPSQGLLGLGEDVVLVALDQTVQVE